MQSADPDSFDHVWQMNEETRIPLHDMMTDYLRHMKDHVAQINDCLESYATK
jgi:hypothetical protein